MADGKSTMQDEVVASGAQDHIDLTTMHMAILDADIKNDSIIKVQVKVHVTLGNVQEH